MFDACRPFNNLIVEVSRLRCGIMRSLTAVATVAGQETGEYRIEVRDFDHQIISTNFKGCFQPLIRIIYS